MERVWSELENEAGLTKGGLQTCEDVVSLIGSLVEVPDKSRNRAAVLKKLDTISTKQGLKAAARLGLAYHTSCKCLKQLAVHVMLGFFS